MRIFRGEGKEKWIKQLGVIELLLSGRQSRPLSEMSDAIMERYIQCTSRLAGDETVISYVRNNIDCI